MALSPQFQMWEAVAGQSVGRKCGNCENAGCGKPWEYISSATDCLRDFTFSFHREHLFLGDFLFLVFCSFPFPKDI